MITIEYKAVCKPHQFKAIDEAIRTTQFIRNKCLRLWVEAGKESNINKNSISKYTTQLRKDFTFVADLNSMAVQAAGDRAWSAISRFYENCKKKIPVKKGYPRFQKDCRSVEYKTSGWSLNQTKRRITFTDKKGIGEVKLLGKWDIHRTSVDLIKRVRIVRRADGYYVQFCVEVENKQDSSLTGREIGIDVGLEYFYSDSNGHHEPNPRFLRKGEKLVKHCQRRIYSKQKHSNNRRKARNRYSRRHLKISRQRIEHAKRLARHVMQSNSLAKRRVYEDLKVRNLVKNHCLAKSINDAGWYQFRVWIEHFASKFRKVAIAVEPHYTSQECPECHGIVKKSLSQRTHICSCGCELQRDHASSIIILNRGKAQLEGIATGGHPGSKSDKKTKKSKKSDRNAWGDATSTGSGENLNQQVVS